MRRVVSLFISLLTTVAVVEAQDAVVQTQAFHWYRLYYQQSLDSSWSLHAEMEARLYLDAGRRHQYLLPRIHLHHYLSPALSFGLGMTHFLQALPQVSEEPVKLMRREWRPHQELRIRRFWNARWKTQQRLMIEQRFRQKTRDGQALSGYRFNLRIRYKYQLNVLLKQGKKAKYYAKMYDELMVNAGSEIVYNLFDQNRVYLGLRYQKPKYSIDMGYINWFQQRSTGNDFYLRHIIRTTLYLTL